MKLLTTGLLIYNAVLTICFITIGLATNSYDTLGPTLLLIPTGAYFTLVLANQLSNVGALFRVPAIKSLSRILFIYSCAISWLLIFASLAASNGVAESSLTILLLPLGGYFIVVVADRKNRAQFYIQSFLSFLTSARKATTFNDQTVQPLEAEPELTTKHSKKSKKTSKENGLVASTESELQPVVEEGIALPIEDAKRRQFLKILGGGGVSLVLMLFFMPQKASAAFFGSTPGPGVIGLKDASGNKIDPAEKTPTDGYNVSQIDDAALPSYYGFVHKSGAWYISKEDSNGAYRYAAGASNFSTNWTNRASLTYNYFDAVF